VIHIFLVKAAIIALSRRRQLLRRQLAANAGRIFQIIQ
jgi:hypothetical protein